MSESEPPAPPPAKKRMVKSPTRGGDNSRMAAVRLKKPKNRTPSSHAWLERQLNDPFVVEAKAKGYRSRAAFKLIEIDDKLKLIKRGMKVIDLGCAPGGWVQVALQRGAGAVVGVDLLPVEPIAGAQLIEMDFTDPACGPLLIELLGAAPDLILCDIAPNTIGHKQTDHLRIIGLIEAAVDFAVEVLKPGGAFVTKAFQGGETAGIIKLMKSHFADVKHVKPKASRAESSEIYLAATGFKGRR
jgi:23S rRNA (uridine2552-2'-O)-methyltransferase